MISIETVVSPLLLPLYDLEGKIAVVTDILRATSCMVAGFDNGVNEIVPVLQPENCQPYRDKGYLCAGERGGIKIEGFDLGNSPLEYQAASVKGKSVVVTTTNGTRALHAAKNAGAKQVLVGAFANMATLAEYIESQQDSVVILCAGWKNRYCLEDTLFAGGLAHYLQKSHSIDCDSTFTALELFQKYEQYLESALKESNHSRRLGKLAHQGHTADLTYCASSNHSKVIPVFNQDRITLL